METVDLDINLRTNVPEEGAKAVTTIQEMADAAITARDETKKSLDLQTAYLEKLRSKYAEVQKALAGMSFPSKEKNELQKASNALAKELESEEGALKTLQAEWDKMNRGYSIVQKRTTEVREEMKLLRAAGRENSEEYARLSDQLQELAEAGAVVSKTQTEMAKGSQVFKGLGDAVSAFSGTASAAVGAWTLLGGSQEEEAKIQTKLQSLMAITIGLQQAQNILAETSTFRISTLTKAKELWAAANTRVATSLGISTAAAKALTATLTLGLSVAIGAVIALFDKWQAKQAETSAKSKAWAEAVTRSGADVLAKYEELRRAYTKLGEDMSAKQKFVDDNKSAFDALGVSVTGVTDADTIFISHTGAFVEALKTRAKAMAAQDLAAEKYKEALKKEVEAGERAKNPTFFDKNAAVNPITGPGSLVVPAKDTSADYAGRAAQKIRKEAEDLEKAGDAYFDTAAKFQADYEAKMKELGLALSSPTSVPPAGVYPLNADISARLAKISADTEKEAAEVALAAMQEGREKKIATINAEFEARKAVIEEKLREIAELETKYGVDGSVQKDQLTALLTAYDEQRSNALRTVSESYSAEIRKIEAELTANAGAELDRRLAQNAAYYAELRARAKATASSEEEYLALATKITKQEEEEKTRIILREELKRLESRERIALRREEFGGRSSEFGRGFFQSDREEELLKVQLQYAEEYLAKLREMQDAGDDVTAQIEEETDRIEELKKSLSDIPVKKLQEAGNALKGLFSKLGSLGGELGEAFSSLASSVDGIMKAFDKGASPLDRASAGLGGLIDLFGIALDQAEKNRRAVDEYASALAEAARTAALLRIEEQGYSARNLFGVENPYARAIAGAEQYKTAMAELSRTMQTMAGGQVQVGSKKVVSGKNILGGVGAGATMGAAIGSFLPGIGNLIGAGIGALFGGIFGATQKKVVPVFESLSKKYGSILRQGSATFELNPRILADYAKLDEATKKLVDNWEEIRKKALEAQESMRQTFADLAGDLGTNLSQALIDAWHQGDMYAAVDDYAAYVDQVLEGIITQKMFSAAFGNLFDTLQKRMEDSFGAGGDSDIVDDIVWFSREYKRGISQFGEAMDKARAELAKEGIQIGSELEAAGRSAAAQGIARASQDDITKFNGQMTLMVERVQTLVALKQAEAAAGDARQTLLRAMAADVSLIAKQSLFLSELDGLKSALRIIHNEGIKMRN